MSSFQQIWRRPPTVWHSRRIGTRGIGFRQTGNPYLIGFREGLPTTRPGPDKIPSSQDRPGPPYNDAPMVSSNITTADPEILDPPTSRTMAVAVALLVLSVFINYVDRGNLSIAAPLLKV